MPVSIGLVIDSSGTIGSAGLVKSSNPQDEAFVVGLNDEAYPRTQCFTSGIATIEQAPTKTNAKGGTAMRDALRMSIAARQEGEAGQNSAAVVTYGNGKAKPGTLEAVAREAQLKRHPCLRDCFARPGRAEGSSRCQQSARPSGHQHTWAGPLSQFTDRA